ncbi:MAG: hypothetical protein ACLTYN_04040 [Dysosmobacter welbionis]
MKRGTSAGADGSGGPDSPGRPGAFADRGAGKSLPIAPEMYAARQSAVLPDGEQAFLQTAYYRMLTAGLAQTLTAELTENRAGFLTAGRNCRWTNRGPGSGRLLVGRGGGRNRKS